MNSMINNSGGRGKLAVAILCILKVSPHTSFRWYDGGGFEVWS